MREEGWALWGAGGVQGDFWWCMGVQGEWGGATFKRPSSRMTYNHTACATACTMNSATACIVLLILLLPA